MTPDAQLRLAVYQEGQRAFNSGTTCPYTDWRKSTWEKGRAAAEKYYSAPLPSGCNPSKENNICGACNGSGWVPRDSDIGTDQECFACDGSGKVDGG